MEEKLVLTGLNVDEDTVGDVLFETRTATAKGFVAGASLVGACWLAFGLYKKFRGSKTKEEEIEEIKEPEEDLVD